MSSFDLIERSLGFVLGFVRSNNDHGCSTGTDRPCGHPSLRRLEARISARDGALKLPTATRYERRYVERDGLETLSFAWTTRGGTGFAALMVGVGRGAGACITLGATGVSTMVEAFGNTGFGAAFESVTVALPVACAGSLESSCGDSALLCAFRLLAETAWLSLPIADSSADDALVAGLLESLAVTLPGSTRVISVGVVLLTSVVLELPLDLLPDGLLVGAVAGWPETAFGPEVESAAGALGVLAGPEVVTF